MAYNQNTQYGGGIFPGAANPSGAPPGGSPAQASKHETGVAGLAHLSSLFAPLIVPLIIWLAVRDSMPYAARQAKQALFFHILMAALGLVVALLLVFVLLSRLFVTVSQAVTSETAASPTVPAWVVAFLAFVLVIVLTGQALSIYGAVQAFQGEDFSYPLLGRL